MAHNYYFDYKLQFDQDRRNGQPPELSETVVYGMAYCSAILLNANKVRHYAYTSHERQVEKGWQGCYGTINSVRGHLLRHHFDMAIAHSNDISTIDVATIMDSLRYEFDEMLFAEDFQNEVYSAAAVQDAGDAIQALYSVFPHAENNKLLNREMRFAITQANIHSVIRHETWTADLISRMAKEKPYPESAQPYVHPDTPFILTARNPLFIAICGIMYADAAATKMYLKGRLTPGPIDKELQFTRETRYDMPINRAEHNKFIMFRRLRRGAMSYVPGFDIYLTYLTDFCRILEAIMPEEVAAQALMDAEKYVVARASIRPSLQPYP